MQENEQEDLKQKSLLRTIKTLRTKKELKDSEKAGYKALKQKEGTSHASGTYWLDNAEAIWNGKKFDIDCRSYDVGITFG